MKMEYHLHATILPDSKSGSDQLVTVMILVSCDLSVTMSLTIYNAFSS